jgi:hypothetical protein
LVVSRERWVARAGKGGELAQHQDIFPGVHLIRWSSMFLAESLSPRRQVVRMVSSFTLTTSCM